MEEKLDLLYVYHLRNNQYIKNQYNGAELSNISPSDALPIFLDYDAIAQFKKDWLSSLRE